MKLLHLREKIPWFGSHSGYEQLTRHLPVPVSIVKPREGKMIRYLGSSFARLRGRDGRGAASFSQAEFQFRRQWTKPDASHILYLESHRDILGDWRGRQKKLTATIHLPPSAWKQNELKKLSCLDAALILYRRDIPFFESYVGKGRVHFLLHGTDTVFFKPDARKISTPPRILYSGVYLRNESMLVRVLERIVKKFPEVKFDLLVPAHHRGSSSLVPLLNHPAVTWHAGLSDEQLRDLYQKSYLMLLPMNESGANTAVVESLTSGLPVVTTDVGGVRDYGGGDLFPVAPNNDDEMMLGLVEKYLSNPSWRNEVSARVRRFAEEKMAWPLIAELHMEFYRKLAA